MPHQSRVFVLVDYGAKAFHFVRVENRQLECNTEKIVCRQKGLKIMLIGNLTSEVLNVINAQKGERSCLCLRQTGDFSSSEQSESRSTSTYGSRHAL